jgi:hypothetical protein
MQHNDIGPLYHLTDVGHVKIVSHMIQYVHQVDVWMGFVCDGAGGAEWDIVLE